jgi:nucleoside transporter
MKLRFSLMMFLQYAIWGAWLPLLYPYLQSLGFSGGQISSIFAGGAAGAILGPMIAGQFADRFFATEKFLGISHLLGAVLVYFLSRVHDFPTFLALSIVYGVIYAPTLALTNSICFHHLPDRDRDFGRVRLWGTIGWIAAGIVMGHWLAANYSPAGATKAELLAEWNRGRADAFVLSSTLGLLLGLFCFTLPHTPPNRDAVEKNAFAEALGFVFRQPLLLLFVLAIPMSCVHQFYFVHASSYLTRFQLEEVSKSGSDLAKSINDVLGVGGGGLMTIGQMSEIAVLALVTVLAKQMSRKALLGIGLAAYAARMALFAYTDSLPFALLGVALHGFCFGCFIFVAFMIVDEETPADVRASAQNLFNLVIVGIGIIVGSWFSADIVAVNAKSAVGNDSSPEYFRALFSVPMWIALACLAVLLLFYPGGRRRTAAKTAEQSPAGA